MLAHVIYYHSDKKYSCLVGIGLTQRDSKIVPESGELSNFIFLPEKIYKSLISVNCRVCTKNVIKHKSEKTVNFGFKVYFFVRRLLQGHISYCTIYCISLDRQNFYYHFKKHEVSKVTISERFIK